MKHILYLFILISFISCDKIKSRISNSTIIDPDSPEVIFEKYKSSVVLIATQYYYEINVDGYVFYYSPSSERKIFSDKEDVLQNLSTTTGTGFIISEKGEIITNNHVVNPKDENYMEVFGSRIANVIEKNRYSIDSLDIEIQNVRNQYNLLSSPQDDSEMDVLATSYNEMVYNQNTLQETYNLLLNLNSNLNNLTSELVIYKVGIAYNDTKVDDFDDLQECTVIKLSDIRNVDLALIQTNTQTFNNTPKTIFNFYDNNPNVAANPEEFPERDISKPVSINDDVFMIGYNRGFTLAITEKGIKSQFTSGKISQECDGVRILYTIPTLEGSSGSPVVDKWGNLVGVNFAKMIDTQSFGFAIPVYELKKFYEQ